MQHISAQSNPIRQNQHAGKEEQELLHGLYGVKTRPRCPETTRDHVV